MEGNSKSRFLDRSGEGSPSLEERVALVVAQCWDRLNSGENLDAAKVVVDHPDLAPHLAEALGVLLDLGPPVESELGFETLGNYRILREIGRGGMGVVYEALQRSTNHQVALKVLPGGILAGSKAKARFHREGQLAAALDHPGICAIYDAGVENGLPYIAMKFLRGETLAGKIARSKEPPTASPASAMGQSTKREVMGIVQLIESVSRSLHCAHEAGLVHRDVKPSNIMVGEDGNPVIFDFGLARGETDDSTILTQSGDLMGTPSYMPPEQIEGRREGNDRRSDIFSLGVTLYECLTLRRPFESPTQKGLFQKILTAPPPDPRRFNSKISRDLKVVLETALEKDPGRRYQTALDLAEDLRRVRCYEPIRARPPSPGLRLRRWTQRNPVLATMIVALFGGLTVSLTLLDQVVRQVRMKDQALNVVKTELIQELNSLWDRPEEHDFVTVSSEKMWVLTGAQESRFAGGEKPLRCSFGVYTHVRPTEMLEMFAPLLSRAEKAMAEILRRPVRIDLVIYRKYGTGFEALVKGRVDFMRIGPASYVLAKKEDPGIALLAVQSHSSAFRGVIFTQQNSGIKELRHLEGRSFAFGDESSTIGGFLAKKYLVEAGIRAKSLSNFEHLRSHDQVVAAVEKGEFAAGAAKESEYLRGKGLKPLKYFEVVSMPWVAGPRLDPGIAKVISSGLLTIQEPSILDPLRDSVTGFTEAEDAYFNPVREDIETARLFEGQ